MQAVVDAQGGGAEVGLLVVPPSEQAIRHEMMPGLLWSQGVASQPELIEVDVLRDVEPAVKAA